MGVRSNKLIGIPCMRGPRTVRQSDVMQHYFMSRSASMSLHTTGLKCRAPVRLLQGPCGQKAPLSWEGMRRTDSRGMLALSSTPQNRQSTHETVGTIVHSTTFLSWDTCRFRQLRDWHQGERL